MVNKHIDLFYKVSLYVLFSTVVLVFSIIYFEYLKNEYPTQTSFYSMPFGMASFIFGMTFILLSVFFYLVFFYFPKIKKKAKKFEKKRRL